MATKKAVKKIAGKKVGPAKPVSPKPLAGGMDVLSGDFTDGKQTGTLIIRYVNTGTNADMQPGDVPRNMRVGLAQQNGKLIVTLTELS